MITPINVRRIPSSRPSPRSGGEKETEPRFDYLTLSFSRTRAANVLCRKHASPPVRRVPPHHELKPSPLPSPIRWERGKLFLRLGKIVSIVPCGFRGSMHELFWGILIPTFLYVRFIFLVWLTAEQDGAVLRPAGRRTAARTCSLPS